MRRPSVHTCIVLLLVAAAAALRLVALDRYPLPVQQDELSNMYDGYCIATYGTDRYGKAWPVILQAMGPGDYRPALYAYLAAATTRITGFSIASGRVPAALAGILTVALVYAVATRLIGRSGGVIALALAAFSPILVQYSRQAHEGACLPPLFSVLALYLTLRYWDARTTRESAVWLAMAGLATGISTNAYGTTRLTALLLVIAVSGVIVFGEAILRRHWGRAMRSVAVLAVGAFVGALPQLWVLAADPGSFLARSQTLALDPAFGPTWWAKRIITGFAAHWDPRLLFFSFGTYGELSIARLSVVTFPVLYVGLLVTIWRALRVHDRRYLLVIATVFICILPAVVTRSNMGIMRASGVWSLYPLVSAIGFCSIASWLNRRAVLFEATCTDWWIVPPKTAMAVCVLLICACGSLSVVRYLRSPALHGVVSQNHIVALAREISERAGEYERVYVDAPGAFGYLYFAAYLTMSPEEFVTAPRDGYVSRDGWHRYRRFGRFYFYDATTFTNDWQSADATGTWLYVDGAGASVAIQPDGRLEFPAGVALHDGLGAVDLSVAHAIVPASDRPQS